MKNGGKTKTCYDNYRLIMSYNIYILYIIETAYLNINTYYYNYRNYVSEYKYILLHDEVFLFRLASINLLFE